MRLTAFILGRSIILGMAIIFLAAPSLLSQSAWGADDSEARATLKGITAVKVVVGSRTWLEDSEFKALFGQLTTDVELRLRKAGIAIDESAADWFKVIVNAGHPDTSGYLYSIEVDLSQWLFLPRTSQSVFASTWSVGGFGSVPKEKFQRHLRDAVADNVDKFINAYLEQNPKR